MTNHFTKLLSLFISIININKPLYHQDTYVTKLKNGNYLVNGVELILNNEYIIIPDNPQKLKHRNRKCILISIENDFIPRTAEVMFLDTKRVGMVELIDLKNIK